MAETEQEQLAPKVSVLVVSEDNARALRRCLQALENAAGREMFEVLVVDNGSQDESPRLDSEFPSATFLRLPRRFGVVKALNIGMRTAKGEYFFFLAPEVEVQSDTVVRLHQALEGEQAAVGVCPLLVDSQGRPQLQFYKLPDAASIVRVARKQSWDLAQVQFDGGEPLPVQFPSLSALMIRAYFLKALRYIDERYGQSWADAEIAMQVRRAARKILLVPEARAILHPAELSPLRSQARVRALYSADWVLGAARFATKHFGFLTGLKLRALLGLEALGRALLAVLTFHDAPYQLARAGFLLSGQKLDGTQRIL